MRRRLPSGRPSRLQSLNCGRGCRCWPARRFLPLSPRPILGRTTPALRCSALAEAIFGYDVGVHWGLIHHLIRKTGHFMGYGIFSLVCFRGFWMS